MPGIALKRWNWLDSALLPLISATMRVAWLAPAIRLALNNIFIHPQGVHYPAWLILLILLGASALQSVLETQRHARLLGLAAGLLTLLAVVLFLFPLNGLDPITWGVRLVASLAHFWTGVPAALLVILFTLALWVRGATIAWDDYGGLWHGFVLGIVALILLALLPESTLYAPSAGLAAWTMAFLILGLFALALISVANALEVERSRQVLVPTLNRYWLLVTAMILLLILLLGWLVGRTVAPNALRELWLVIRPAAQAVWDVLSRIALYILSVGFSLLYWLLRPLAGYLRGLLTGQRPEIDVTRSFEEQLEELQRLERGAPPAMLTVARVAFYVVLGLTIILLLLMAWRARRPSRSRPTGVIEKREFVWSKELLLDQIGALFRHGPRAPATGPYLELGDLSDPRHAVRHLYQRLLILAAARGYPRQAGQTPLAYLITLEQALPEAREALRTLTDIYALARYAPETPNAELVVAAQSALRQIQQAVG
jgi:hypothetical protein